MTWRTEDYDWHADDAQIERIQQRFPHLRLPRISTMRGWFPIVERWCEDVSDKDGVTVAQIKQKFSVLCIYTRALPRDDRLRHDVDMLTALAECRAARACEVCGGPAVHRIRSGYWHMCRCDEHADGGVVADNWRALEVIEIGGQKYRYDADGDCLWAVT